MIQSTNDAIQILPTNTSDIVFANDELKTRSASCRGWLNHTEGTSQFTILGSGNCNQANVFDITFTGNVSGETAGPVEISLKENGTRVVGASANATVVVGEYTNIVIKKRIRLCPRENVTLSIGSISALSNVTPSVETVPPTVKNANIIIDPVF